MDEHPQALKRARGDVFGMIAESGRKRRPAPVELASETQFGGYTLHKRVGEGAFGEVWSAVENKLMRLVALKILKVAGTDETKRLLREAQMLAQLEHPNIVRVVTTGEDPRPFIEMEYVHGVTLYEHCLKLDGVDPRFGRPAWRAKLDAYIEAGRGLAAAHDKGMVHRDFKPQNVLVGEEGAVRVADFGLARASKDPTEAPVGPDEAASHSASMLSHRITRTGGRMGTPQYMAPEVHEAKEATAKSDQYSFCVALFEALKGRPPFEGKTEAALHEAKIAGRVTPQSGTAPTWLRRVILRGLQADPEARYPSMHELLAALANDPRRRLLRALGAVAAVSAIALAVWLLKLNEERHAARTAAAERDAAAAYERALEEAENAARAERSLIERSDRLTLLEVERALPADPTYAIANLERLSASAPAWDGVARIIAADAEHRGVARTEVKLSDDEIAHGLSPDGSTLVTRNPKTGEVRLLDLATTESRTLATTDAILPIVSFSPHGDRLAALRLRGGLGVWELATLEHRPLGDSPAEHNFVPFSPDGSKIVTYGRHPEVHVWDLATGARSVLPDHVEPVRSVRVSARGDRIATVDDEGTVRLWGVAAAPPDILDGTDPIAFGPDDTLVSAMGRDLLLHGPKEGDEPRHLAGRGAPIVCVQISSDGRWLAAGDVEGGVRIWALNSGATHDLLGHTDGVRSVRFADDGDLLTSASLDRTLAVWHVPSGRSRKLEGHVGVSFWAVDPTSGEVVTVGHEGRVRRWDPVPPVEAAWLAHPGSVATIATGRGQRVATGSDDGVVREWSGEAWADIATHGAPITAMAYAADGLTLASADADGALHVRPPGAASASLGEAGSEVVALAFTATGTELAVAQSDADVSLWTIASGERRTLPTADFLAARLHACEDGELLAVAGWRPDGVPELRWLRLRDGDLVRTVALPDDGLPAATFSADCRAAAITTALRSVLLWDATTDALRELPETHGGQVEGVAFSPDGLTLATASHDGTARLWDVRTGRRREVVLGIADPHAIAFLRDGTAFVAGGDGPTVYLGRDDLPRGAEALREWLTRATEVEVELAHLD